MDNLYRGNKMPLPEYIADKILYSGITLSDAEIIKRFHNDIKPIISRKHMLKILKYTLTEEIKEAQYYENIFDMHFTTPIDKHSLLKIKEFICLHRFKNPQAFQPNMIEIISQIPNDIINDVNYFEIIEKPKTIFDATTYDFAFSRGYHLSKIMTYTSK